MPIYWQKGWLIMTNLEIAKLWEKKLAEKGSYINNPEFTECLGELLVPNDMILELMEKLQETNTCDALVFPVETILRKYKRFHKLTKTELKEINDMYVYFLDWIDQHGICLSEGYGKAAINLFIASEAKKLYLAEYPNANMEELVQAAINKFQFTIVDSAGIGTRLLEDENNPELSRSKFLKRLSNAIENCGYETQYSPSYISVDCGDNAIFVTSNASGYTVTSQISGDSTHKRFRSKLEVKDEVMNLITAINHNTLEEAFKTLI